MIELTANSTGPEEINAPPILDPRIAGWYFHGKARRRVIAGLLAVDPTPRFTRHRG